jgi:hypothetical protein
MFEPQRAGGRKSMDARSPAGGSLSARQDRTASREMAPSKHRPLTPVSPLPCHENALLSGALLPPSTLRSQSRSPVSCPTLADRLEMTGISS